MLRTKKAGLPIDLAILDVVMPGMSGPELLECLRYHGIVPQRLLYISGYPRDFITDRRGVDVQAKFRQKPFTGAKLVEVVAQIMS